jgi:NTE family protein
LQKRDHGPSFDKNRLRLHCTVKKSASLMLFSDFLRGRGALTLLLACFVICPCVDAQAQEQKRRPKIGVVLSGGGALGMSHIGALKVLEELQIPVDYIGGTSMGAIVALLYASGLSPAEIDDWFRTADWTFLLADALPRQSESFRSKERELDMNKGFAMNVGKKGELKLPKGLIDGRNIMASLRELTVRMRDVRDFDKLRIPYRAVATDFLTGKPVVLRQGDFVEAARASMSIPGVFSPRELDGKMLVDGGISMNLPIGPVQAMGADVIIAIDASGQILGREELDSAAAMTNQVLTLFVQKQMEADIARLGPGDALLRIPLHDVDPTDFMKAAEVIDAGYKEASKLRAKLARYSAGADAFQQFLGRQRYPRGEPVMVSYLKIRTPEGESDYRLPRPMPFDVKKLDNFARLQTLMGDVGPLQKYAAGDYEVIGEEGKHGLLVKAHEKKVGPRNFEFGLRYGYSSTDETDFGVLVAYRATELNSWGAEWETFLSLGDSTRIATEWYQPLDPSRRFFVAANALFGSNLNNGRDPQNHPLRFRRQDLVGGVDLGARLGQPGELRLGYIGGSGRISRRLGVAEDVPTSIDRGWLHATVAVDTLDGSSFATKGAYGRLTLLAAREELGSSDNYTRLEGQFYKPLTFGKNTVVPRVAVSLELTGKIPLYDQVPLGGFLNMSGLSHGDLFGTNSALAEIVFYRKIKNLTPGLVPGLYAGFSLEAGQVFENRHDFRLDDMTLAGSIFVGADTLGGAFVLGLGITDGGNAAVYLQLGPLFNQGRSDRQPPK